MTKLTCGHQTSYNSFCKNPVAVTTSRCAAGHPVNKKRMAAALKGETLPDVMTVQFDVDDVFEAAGAEELVWNDITFHHAKDIQFDADGNPVATHRCVECGMGYPAKQGTANWKLEYFGVPEKCNNARNRHRIDNTCRGDIVAI